MAKVFAKIDIKFDPRIVRDMQEWIKAWVEWMALAFERTAKILTTEEEHVVTGRYRASINLNSDDWFPRDTVNETQSWDGIHNFVGNTMVQVWTNVEYAIHLEKRYGILARAMDMSKSEMKELFITAFKKKVKWLQ